MYSGLDIARYIIDKCYNSGKPITNLQLQKILYFVQGEYYKKTGNFLIDDDFLAWQYGPVLGDVYHEYSWYCSSRIYEEHNVDIPEDVCKIIDPVIKKRRNQTAGKLVSESHKDGGAWEKYYDGFKSTVIPKRAIAKEFGVE